MGYVRIYGWVLGGFGGSIYKCSCANYIRISHPHFFHIHSSSWASPLGSSPCFGSSTSPCPTSRYVIDIYLSVYIIHKVGVPFHLHITLRPPPFSHTHRKWASYIIHPPPFSHTNTENGPHRRDQLQPRLQHPPPARTGGGHGAPPARRRCRPDPHGDA